MTDDIAALHTDPRPLREALLVAGALLLASAALRWSSPEILSAEQASRVLGVLLASVVIRYANRVPKLLGAQCASPATAAEAQAVQRLTGWALVLGGAAYAGAWLIAPIEDANRIAGSALATMLTVVAVRVVISKRKARA